jgi:hypothetical protein
MSARHGNPANESQGTDSDAERAMYGSSIRILSSPEELAAAIVRAEQFERRNTELLALRTERHHATLAKSPSVDVVRGERSLLSA